MTWVYVALGTVVLLGAVIGMAWVGMERWLLRHGIQQVGPDTWTVYK